MIDLFRHELEIVLELADDPETLDPEGADYGTPASSEVVAATVRGLIQPRSARERASIAGNDVAIGSYRGFLEIAAIDSVTQDAIIRKSGDPDADLDGDYRVLFVGNAAGWGHHVELDLERIIP